MQFIDDNLDTITKGLVIVAGAAFVVGVTFASAGAFPVILGITGTTLASTLSVLGTLTGGLGLLGSVVQIGSGLFGKKLTGEDLSSKEKTERISNGIVNSLSAVTSMYLNSELYKSISKTQSQASIQSDKGVVGEDGGKSYNSFNEFKKENSVKEQCNHWHHIVEQNQVKKSGFDVKQINNTNNLIELTPSQHSKISGYYSSKQDFTSGLTVREWLAGQNFDTQYQFGIDKLKEYKIIK